MSNPIDVTKLDVEQLQTLINRYQERRLTSDPAYGALVAGIRGALHQSLAPATIAGSMRC